MNLETVVKNLSKQMKSKILGILVANRNLDVLTQDKDSALCLYQRKGSFYFDKKEGFWLNFYSYKNVGKIHALAGDYQTAIISRERLVELLQEPDKYSHITNLLPSHFYVKVDDDFDKELFFDVLESMNVEWRSKHPLRFYTPPINIKYSLVRNEVLTCSVKFEPYEGKDVTKLFSKLPERWFVVLDDIDIDKFDAYCKKKDFSFFDSTGVRETLKNKCSRSFLVKYNGRSFPYNLVFSSDPEGENLTHLFLTESCKSTDTTTTTDTNDMSNVLIIEDKEYVESDTTIEPGDILTTYKKAKVYTFIAMDGSNYIVKTSKGGLLTIDNPIKLVHSSVLHYAAIELEDGSVSLTGIHSSKHSLDSLLKSQLKYLKYKKVTYLTYQRG